MPFGYVSPSFSGLQASAVYSANENKNESNGAKINLSGYDLGLNYNNGPVMVGLTYARASAKNEIATQILFLGSDEVAKNFRLGGMYDFGNATVRVLFDRTKADGSLNNVKQTCGASAARTT
jgi:predicted porin